MAPINTSLGHALGAVTADIGGVTSPTPVEWPTLDRALEVQAGRVHRGRPRRCPNRCRFQGWLDAAMAAAVMGDDAVAAGSEEEHLVLEASALSGQPWLKTTRLSGAPVVVIDPGAVLWL